LFCVFRENYFRSFRMNRTIVVIVSIVLIFISLATVFFSSSVNTKFDTVDSIKVDARNTRTDTTDTGERVRNIAKKLTRELDSLKRVDSVRDR
jgi:hypothetical protein